MATSFIRDDRFVTGTSYTKPNILVINASTQEISEALKNLKDVSSAEACERLSSRFETIPIPGRLALTIQGFNYRKVKTIDRLRKGQTSRKIGPCLF